MARACWVLLAAGLVGCAGTPAHPPKEIVTTLEASGIERGLYATFGAQRLTGEHPTLVEVLPGERVRVVASRGGKESACVAAASVKTIGDKRTLSLRCASAPLDLAFIRSSADAIELTTDRGEPVTLARVRDGHADVRATCTTGGFAARLAVMATAGRRRVVLTPIRGTLPGASPTPSLASVPRQVAVLGEADQGPLVGRDLFADEVDLTLPKGALPPRFDAALGVVDVMSPFAIHREAHPLSCVVDS
ncbi:MAG: hypothetical protein U0235_24220 [Polyangiaceae bacterium]